IRSATRPVPPPTQGHRTISPVACEPPAWSMCGLPRRARDHNGPAVALLLEAWEQELHLDAQLPVGREPGLLDVVVALERRVDRQLAQLEQLADAPPPRHGPLRPAFGLPVP